MKRVSLLIGLLIFVFSGVLYSQPKLEVEGGDTYDWGQVKAKDSPLKCKIRLKNTGDKLLKISNVRPGCGCTTAPLDKNEVEPGEYATLDVKLTVRARNGNVTKPITITSNDPEKERRVIYLKANVVVPLSTAPSTYFAFTNITVGSEQTVKLSIQNKSQKDIKLSDFEVNNDQVQFSLTAPTVIKAGEEIEVKATAKPTKKGHFNFTVKMKTDHPDYKEFKIAGYGNAKESPVFTN